MGHKCFLYGVIGHHVTLWEGHMIANHPIYGGDWLSCDPLCIQMKQKELIKTFMMISIW